MRWMKIVATTAALSLAAATLPATAQAGHYGHGYGYGYGYNPFHHKRVFVHKHRHRGGDALAAGIIGLTAGAILGSLLSQPRYPRHYHAYRAPAYAPVYGAPVYGTPPVGSPDWYAYCASKYRSFDPTDGTFQPYHGPRRLCQ